MVFSIMYSDYGFLAFVGTGTSIVSEPNETSNQENLEQWLAEKFYESRQPMHDVYYRVFTSLVTKGSAVEEAKRQAIALVERTFGIQKYTPPVVLEADDWF